MAISDNMTNTPAAGAKDCKSVSKVYALVAGESLSGKIAADADLNGNIAVGKKATISVQAQICIENA